MEVGEVLWKYVKFPCRRWNVKRSRWNVTTVG